MALSEIEQKILKRVVEHFAESRKATERIVLVQEFEDPDAIDQLNKWQLLKTFDNTYYLPTSLSFHYCGDAALEAEAKRGMEVMATIFRNMYLSREIDFTPDGLRKAALKVDNRADERMIRLGLYVAQDFALLSGYAGGNQQKPDITPTGISESVVKLKNVDTLWDDYIRNRIPWPVQDSTGGIIPRHSMFQPHGDAAEGSVSEETYIAHRILVFLSHSSKDADLALALIELLKSGLGLLSNQIRCSSVDGYRLPVGVNTESKLREEVNEAKVVIGLITPSSLSSAFVMFELGARWGANHFLAPLLAGVAPSELRGPLSLLNALSGSNEAQLHQLLENIAAHLGLRLQSVASYTRYVSIVRQLSEGVTSIAVASPSGEKEMIFEESVYWKRQNGEREGPYCTVCYENENKEIHLNPGATKGTYGCGVCRNSFRTKEYNPSSRIGPSQKPTTWS